MARAAYVNTVETEFTPHYSAFKSVMTIFWGRKLAVFGLVIIVLTVLTAIFASQLAPYDPYKIDLGSKLLQPTSVHLLGTDSLGRDTLSRLIYGARTSLLISAIAVTCGAVIGQFLGLIAAYFGSYVSMAIMRSIDAILCVPSILVALIIATILGGGIRNLIIALAVGVIPGQARLMCAQALSIKQNDYILASKVHSAGNLRIMLQHILPNAFPPLLVMISIDLGTVLLAEASLSFIGVGIEPPTAAWGSMVNDGYIHLATAPIQSFAPGLAIMVVVFAFQMMGDGLRDALDPRLRGAF